MIRVLTTAAHRYTHAVVAKALRGVAVLGYEDVLRARTLRAATYVFTDLDRLGFWELELAADLFGLLRKAGCVVLNDPARVVQRAGMLHRLHAAGMNSFAVWRAEDGALPDRFPVFLRTAAAHRGVLTDLLPDDAAARAALDRAVAEGYPLRDLLFVEYCARPSPEGTFRKHAVYRVGATFLAGPSVLDTSWVAKKGVAGLARDDDFAIERDLVLDGTFVDAVRPAFDAAAIDYGRADFAVIDGRVAIYEINTNPNMPLDTEHRSAIHSATLELVRTRYLEALTMLDRDYGGGRVALVSPRFERGLGRFSHRRRIARP